MAGPTTEAAAAAAEATASSEVKKPPPLTTGEKVVAILLCIAGLLLIGLTLFAFSGTDSSFTFKSKEKVAREYSRQGTKMSKTAKKNQAMQKNKQKNRKKVRHNKQGHRRKHHKQKQKVKPAQSAASAQVAKKGTREVEFSDAVAIFALTLGGALTLAGGFYSRLRSLKLGVLELGFVSEEDKKTAANSAATKVAAKITDPIKKPAAEAAAGQVAIADLSKAVATGVEPTDQLIQGIADQAAKKVAVAIN